ncbi:MAG: Hpt domain-containing protein [Deltaproteobacteria bacterium]|nr:Hpt domain-containing protein [Deltaproteobacteria bacterium]
MNLKFEEYLELYISDNFYRLENIENNILAIEMHGFDQEAYETIMRDLHTIKGDSMYVSLPVVSHICEKMEEIFTIDCNWKGEEISEKVKITLDFVDIMRSFFNATLSSPANEEKLKSFFFDLMKNSWTTQPLGSNGIRLRQSESLMIGEIVFIRPLPYKNKILFNQLHQDFIDMGDNIINKFFILDLTNLQIVPLCMLGWAFNLKEELQKFNSRLFLTGLKPDAVSLKMRKKMSTHFDIKEKLSDFIFGFLTTH